VWKLNAFVFRAQANHGRNAKADAKADALQSLNFFLTLDVDTTHFNGLPSFSIFEIFRFLSLPLLCCYK
jgi:hypothetical protein